MSNIKNNKIYKEKKCEDFRELVSIATKDFSDNIAFTVKDKNKKIHDITFNEFNNNIKELGTALLNLNLRGKKIGIISPDRYEWCCSYLTIATTGNIIVPLDYLLPESELISLIKKSQMDAIIFDSRYKSLVESLLSEGSTMLTYCICMDSVENNDKILSFNDLLLGGKELLASGNTEYDSIEIDKNKLSVLIYTSGTTSEPKAVMLSQYNICSNVSAMTTLIKQQPNDSILLFLPLHHTLACLASFLFCYYIGFRLCFADSLKSIGKNINEYGISGLVSVPAVLEIMYKQIIREIKKQNKYIIFKIMILISNILFKLGIDIRRTLFKTVLSNLGNMRTIIYGSASTDKKVVSFFNSIGITMIQGYGLTETSPVIACQSDKFYRKIGSCGYPLFNEQVKINNPDESGIGEILVKGPNIMLGYYNNTSATEAAFNDGWFCTGDLGKVNKSGLLYVTGRIKDVIVLQNGKKVFPQELETILNKLDLVTESMIYESVDQQGNQRICAKIVYSTDNPLIKDKSESDIYASIEESLKKINKSLPMYKYIRHFSLTTEPLIKTTTQKIKRHEELKKINNTTI